MVRFYAEYEVHCASMKRTLTPWLLVLIALGGCSSKPPESTVSDGTKSPVEEQKTPQETLHEQLRSGIFQLGAGLDSIESALNEAHKTKATSQEIKEALADLEDAINDAGGTLAEEDDDAPTLERVTADMPTYEARRKKLCDLINDSLHSLNDARGIVDGLAPSDDQESPLEPVGQKIDVAMDDLRGALEALGGQEETDE
ncbi:MAG: hypothetical protein BGO01_15665 [Armatimonadetes bacterium 55-13]|nr:MAG: hypothetical protein BGO01_15665 [Armatimonadetes bacterium 55-13]